MLCTLFERLTGKSLSNSQRVLVLITGNARQGRKWVRVSLMLLEMTSWQFLAFVIQ